MTSWKVGPNMYFDNRERNANFKGFTLCSKGRFNEFCGYVRPKTAPPSHYR